MFGSVSCKFYFITVNLVRVPSKANDTETVCSDCRSLKQLLNKHSLSPPKSSFPGNVISCFLSRQLSGGSKLDN